MTTATKTPNTNLIYLFALGATGIATGAQFAVPSLAVYAAIIAVGAIAGMIVTRAGFGKATLAFLVSSSVAALLYYFVVAGMLASAGDAAAASATGETAETRAAISAAADGAGSAIGAFVAVIAFVQTFVPGLLGSGIGALVRPKKAAAAQRQPAMAA